MKRESMRILGVLGLGVATLAACGEGVENPLSPNTADLSGGAGHKVAVVCVDGASPGGSYAFGVVNSGAGIVEAVVNPLALAHSAGGVPTCGTIWTSGGTTSIQVLTSTATGKPVGSALSSITVDEASIADRADMPNQRVEVQTNFYHGSKVTFAFGHDAGGEGCTPGYWKNHTDRWIGYTPGDDFDATFGVNAFAPDRTLLTAARTGGGKMDRLGRHATAALLNASSGISYGMSAADVIAAVQSAVADGNVNGAATMFEQLNEQGCPLGGTPAT